MDRTPTLFPYQKTGAHWLATKRHALLADEMRVGKAVQAVVASDIIRAERILVVCPAVARINWSREYGKFSSRSQPVNVLLSSKDAVSPSGVNIVSYDLLPMMKFPGPYDLLILDESHYLKNPTARRTKAVYGARGLIHSARRTWCLTGTPAPNNAAELWLMLYVFGVYQGGYEAFVYEFCTGFNSIYGFQITGIKNVTKLKSLLSGFVLRRRMKDVRPELPPIEFSDYVINGKIETPDDACRINLDREALRVDETLSAASDMSHLSAPTLRRYTGIAKVDAVAELVSHEIDGGSKKIVLFTIHHEVHQRLCAQLSRYGVCGITGQTSPDERDRAIHDFQFDPRRRVFIGQIVAAGTNIDLSVADEALFVEASWVPGENAQAAARLQNVNKNRSIHVRFVALADSIDERVQAALRRKTKDLTSLFGRSNVGSTSRF